MTSSIILAAIALLFIFWAVGAYRRLSRQRKQCKAAFAKIDVQLTHRHDLISRLAEIAPAYLTDKGEALAAVISADNEAVAASARAGRNALNTAALARLAETEAAFSGALDGMLTLAQQHSDLSSDRAMQQLIEELSAVKSKIAFANQVYNEAAAQYNAARRQFPGSIIAFVFAFPHVALLQNARVQPAQHS